MGRFDDALAAYDQAARDYPEDAVIRCGRSAILKALGRLEEAQAGYVDVLRTHPSSAYAANGLASVLAAQGKWEEALANLPSYPPVTESDWVAYHIRGMILLRRGDVRLAVGILEEGLRSAWPSAQKSYFQTALAVAKLREKAFLEASRCLADTSEPAIQVQADLLRVHAYGALRDRKRAMEIYNRLPRAIAPSVQALKLELGRRYLEAAVSRQSDEWIIEREIDAFLLAA
jgi:tetratricopeptide (TPR) repeat protein